MAWLRNYHEDEHTSSKQNDAALLLSLQTRKMPTSSLRMYVGCVRLIPWFLTGSARAGNGRKVNGALHPPKRVTHTYYVRDRDYYLIC